MMAFMTAPCLITPIFEVGSCPVPDRPPPDWQPEYWLEAYDQGSFGRRSFLHLAGLTRPQLHQLLDAISAALLIEVRREAPQCDTVAGVVGRLIKE